MRAVEELKLRGSAGAVRFFAQHSAPIVRRPFYFSHNFAFLITVKLSICHIFVSDKYTIPHKTFIAWYLYLSISHHLISSRKNKKEHENTILEVILEIVSFRFFCV